MEEEQRASSDGNSGAPTATVRGRPFPKGTSGNPDGRRAKLVDGSVDESTDVQALVEALRAVRRLKPKDWDRLAREDVGNFVRLVGFLEKQVGARPVGVASADGPGVLDEGTRRALAVLGEIEGRPPAPPPPR